MSWSEDWSEIAPPPPPTPLPHSPRPPQMDPLCQNGHPSPSPIIHFAKKSLPLENLQNPTLQIQLRWSCHQNIISNFQRWAWVGCLHFISWAHHMRRVCIRGVHISMGKFQNGFLKKHIAVPGCILLPENKYVRVEHFDPGKWEFWIFSISMGISMGKRPKI